MSTLDVTRPGCDEAELVAALKGGDEAAFVTLLDAHGSMLLRVVMTYVSSRAVAEEVVQETWLGVLKGLDGFEGRASLKTWIFRIAANIARTRAVRERRSLPFSALDDPDRFPPSDPAALAGDRACGAAACETPEDRLLSGETRRVILEAIDRLPPAQRLAVTLRDLEGWSAEEACEALGVADGHQRVLLHRARVKVRAALERHLDAAGLAA
jgi:RNA polymerase sigma-70 factor, ECF subfamily